MFFSRRLSLGDLATLSRVLRQNLSAGLSVHDVFRQQSQRGPAAVRPVAERVAASLATGASLIDSLETCKSKFPPMFLSLARVGEETGHMPEAFRELEQYFTMEQKLRRQFISQSILPVVQFFFAVFLIAGLIFILGKIAESRPGTAPIAIFGLSGSRGAVRFLVLVLGTVATLIAAYIFFKTQFRNLAFMEALLLRVPVLGGCLEAIAMSRLCVAMHLTLDSGITIMNAMRLSLDATGNNAFSVHAKQVTAVLKSKKPLSEALLLVRPLPPAFLDLVASAEVAGKVPEMARQQAEYYQEEASRRMTGVTRLASGMLYMTYAGCAIFAIFSVAMVYIDNIKIK
jgi:type II secretory pathway component PulF